MVCGLQVMYFWTDGMALLIESPEYEGEIGVRAAAIGLMIGVPAAMAFAVLLTPEFLAFARGARADAIHARWYERHFCFRLRRRRNHEHRAARTAHRPLCDRTQQEAL